MALALTVQEKEFIYELLKPDALRKPDKMRIPQYQITELKQQKVIEWVGGQWMLTFWGNRRVKQHYPEYIWVESP